MKTLKNFLLPGVSILFQRCPIEAAGVSPGVQDEAFLERLISGGHHHAAVDDQWKLAVGNRPIKMKALLIQPAKVFQEVSCPMDAEPSFFNSQVYQKIVIKGRADQVIFVGEAQRNAERRIRNQKRLLVRYALIQRGQLFLQAADLGAIFMAGGVRE